MPALRFWAKSFEGHRSGRVGKIFAAITQFPSRTRGFVFRQLKPANFCVHVHLIVSSDGGRRKVKKNTPATAYPYENLTGDDRVRRGVRR